MSLWQVAQSSGLCPVHRGLMAMRGRHYNEGRRSRSVALGDRGYAYDWRAYTYDDRPHMSRQRSVSSYRQLPRQILQPTHRPLHVQGPVRWPPVATGHAAWILYAGGEPVNITDPSGRDTVEFALRTEEAVPMAKLVDIYGCFAGVAFASVSLDLPRQDPDWRTGVGAAGATFGCVSLYFPESSANAVVQGIITATPAVNYAFCGFAIYGLIHDLNEVAEGKENASVAVSDAFGALTGCVGARLSTLIKTP
jgi:hypothetical protein